MQILKLIYNTPKCFSLLQTSLLLSLPPLVRNHTAFSSSLYTTVYIVSHAVKSGLAKQMVQCGPNIIKSGTELLPLIKTLTNSLWLSSPSQTDQKVAVFQNITFWIYQRGIYLLIDYLLIMYFIIPNIYRSRAVTPRG